METTDCDPYFDHCDIQGGVAGFGGSGAGSNYTIANYSNNIELNPVYISPSGGAGNGYDGLAANWQLQSTSPCINAGDTTGVGDLLPDLDLGGNPRFNGIIDIGAYEACNAPAQPSTITGATTPCQGSSQTYSVTNVSGVTYTWTVPTGWSITNGQGSNSITVTVGSSSGNISVTPSNSCGNGTARTLAVTVNTVPAQPSTITGNTTPCQNSTQVYSVTNVAGITYTWTVPSGSTITSGQGSNSITVTIGATSGNISVTPSNSCGNGSSSTLAVAVNYVTANAGSDQSVPYGTSTTLNGTASNGSGNYRYSWQPANLLINPNIQNPTTVDLTVSTQFTLTVTDVVSGCTANDQVLITITGGPLTVTAVANPDQICEGNSSQLNAIASGGSEAYTYSWTSNPAGFTSTLQNPVVYPTITTTYTVVVNDGSNSVSDDVLVTVNLLPATPTVPTGPDIVDLYYVSTSDYSTNPVNNAEYYIWVLEPSNMGTITGNGTSIVITWSGVLGDCSLNVQAVNACGESNLSESLSIHVDNTVSVDDVEYDKTTIYPNPNNGVFFIKSSEVLSELIVFDQMGKLISKIQKPDENQKFDYSQLSPGVYFVHIVSQKGIIVKKIITH